MNSNEMPFRAASDNDRALVKFGVGCGNALLRAWEEVNAKGVEWWEEGRWRVCWWTAEAINERAEAVGRKRCHHLKLRALALSLAYVYNPLIIWHVSWRFYVTASRGREGERERLCMHEMIDGNLVFVYCFFNAPSGQLACVDCCWKP